ncbi:MAG TPA: hypothetical protein VFR36_08750 [Sphingomicrobium sp.]|nr:hypothetical protein [Sphingomicrobium sp.]
MMTTAVPLTLYLLILIGGYELAAGLAGFTGRINFQAMIDEFGRSPSLAFMTGFIVYIIGGILVMVHHHWTDLPAIIVSAIGWIAVAEGLLIMVLPKPVLAFSRPFVERQRGVSLFAMLFGVVLILLGFFGRVGLPALI